LIAPEVAVTVAEPPSALAKPVVRVLAPALMPFCAALIVMPPLVISDEEVDEVLDRLDLALAATAPA